MKTNLKYLLLGLLSVSLASCASMGRNGYAPKVSGDEGYVEPGKGGYDDYGYGHSSAAMSMEPAGDKGYEGIPMMGGESSAAPIGDVPPGEDSYPDKPSIPAGQLTCSALDDNGNYEYWKAITSGNQGDCPFFTYRNNIGESFNTYNRVKLTVNNADNVYITLKGDNKTFHVDNFHNAYLFPKEARESYEVDISYVDVDGIRKTTTKTVKDNDVIDLENKFVASTNLEIMFVIDATGSMGDEMNYIKSEIDDVIGKVKQDNPGSTVSLAMMVYRDLKDEYVTRYSDFTQDIASQQNWLKEQKALGGGDFEEAVDTALTEAINKQWSAEGTKLLFHVADAPSHHKDISTWSKAVDDAAKKGIQIMSVAASGIDKKTEFLFRSQSIMTGGQYVFLTDDSGIGGSHETPTIEDKLVVEYLNDCMIRLINGYHKGELENPIPYTQVVRQ